MKKRRFILADKDMGVFLGTYDGRELGYDDDGRVFACFSRNNPFNLTTACSFRSKFAAETFAKDMFAPNKAKKLSALEVETDSEFPSVVDIIKSGHNEAAGDMLEILFENGNQTIH
jgi:hypothetical protein